MNFETKQNFESLLTVCFPPRKKMHAALKLISAKGKHKQGLLLLLLFIKRVGIVKHVKNVNVNVCMINFCQKPCILISLSRPIFNEIKQFEIKQRK